MVPLKCFKAMSEQIAATIQQEKNTDNTKSPRWSKPKPHFRVKTSKSLGMGPKVGAPTMDALRTTTQRPYFSIL
jgi:hypothetical protein